ncbi:hypothetical protein OMP38_30085 [Cohnella ginsengisoli]|uniref:Uncharacterized protein n=1 Tax=Cohnella ginsengisoli TaxID=425004 RepID=A0A9X4KM52_9BACL|nr:hypothetical protein [Cohnella ginsengisoli]MDG0794618.1 hypothetical protein [Cohnella ginsengisoli]
MDKRTVRIAAAALALAVGMTAGTTATGHAEAAGYTLLSAFKAGDARIAAVEAAVLGANAEDTAVELATKRAERQSRSLPHGVVIGGLNLGGMRANTAIATVRTRIGAALDGRVRLITGPAEASPAQKSSEAAPTWRELGLQLNAEEAIRAIARYRDAGWLNRRAAGRAIAKRFSIETVWDEETFAEKAEAMWGALAEKQPIDSVRSIDAFDRVVYSPETPGETLDIPSLLAAFKKHAPPCIEQDAGFRRRAAADRVSSACRSSEA